MHSCCFINRLKNRFYEKIMSTNRSSNWPSSPCNSLEVHSLGIVELSSVLALQELIAFEIGGRQDTLGTLLLCEHPPVATVGREGSHAHFGVGPEELISRQIDVQWIARGGGNLVHTPGQLLAYLILPLQRMNVTPGAFLNTLERALILACAAGGVNVRIHNRRAVARTGEVGQIGTLVKSGVTQFGLSVNVNPNLQLMRFCQTGDDECRFSSLAADGMKHVAMSTIRESLAHHLTELFHFETRHWYTGHPLLTRTKKKVYVHS